MWPLTLREIAEVIGAPAPDTSDSVEDIFIAYRDGDYDGHADVERVVDAGGWAIVSDAPGPRRLFVEDTLVAARTLAAWFRRRFPFPVIAVGGSNGKTTTKELIAAALGPRASKTAETMNGWTGIPFTILDRRHHRDEPPSALVLEIGIDAVGAMRSHAALVDPDLSVLTMIGPEHLAGLRDVDTVAREELELFTERARRVVNMADPRLAAAARQGDVRVEGWRRIDVGPYWTGIAYPKGSSEAEFEVPLAGAHNASNLALAVAVARALGRTDDEIRSGLVAFEAPSMRCQVHRLATDTILIDDAYNASPPSMAAAFALLDEWPSRPRVLVLGDMLDLGEASASAHLALVPMLERMKNARIFLRGEAMKAVHAALPGSVFLGPDDTSFLAHVRGAVVLVKGSRGMHLEHVVMEIRERGEHTTAEDLRPLHPLFATACVTGTNGKTTTTSMISAITRAAGETPCRVTTIGAFIDDVQLETEPSGAAFVRTLLEARDRGVKTLAIETSSQSLENGFTKTWPARVGVFTNLSRDHLDYHGTPEKYLVAKAQLFIDLPLDGTAVLNAADPASALLDEVIDSRVRRLAYAARPVDAECTRLPLALSAREVTIDVEGTHAVLDPSPIAEALGGRLDLRLVGHVHMENALAAALAGHALGYSFEVIERALATFEGVPGRFQIVHRHPTVVVDYAHTPDALARTLATARALRSEPGARVIVVFGCGGDRDPGKRSQMGGVAVDGADVVYITNDNPRSEDPQAIADAILSGITQEASRRTHCILDREEAIRNAVRAANPADIVVVAGKGHEKTQTIGDDELPFDDVEIARAVFR